MADSKPAAYGAPAAQALPSPITDRVRPNAKLIALLSLGHFVVDLNQGSLPWVLLAAMPFGMLFLMTQGVLAFVMLGLFGAILTSSFSVSIVLGQAYLPRNSGTASGLIVGFAIGAGGLGVTALGWIADRYGLPAALWISAAMPLLAFVAARFLPAPRALETR
jgi:predicted MFS family arabinose efflux permease